MTKTCGKCHGYGYIQIDDGHFGMPQAIPCTCVLKRALELQARKAWAGLEVVPAKRTSLLKGKMRDNLVVKADKSDLMLHLRSALAHHARPEEFVKAATKLRAFRKILKTAIADDPSPTELAMSRFLIR